MSDDKRKSPHDFEPHAMGDGLRFHVRVYRPHPHPDGDRWEVYGVGLDHICDCLTRDAANMVAETLEQAAMKPARADDIDLFAADTTLADIGAASWTDWSGAGGWYGYERSEDGVPVRVCVPAWVRQLVTKAHDGGLAEAQRAMREAFGLEEKS